MNINQLKARIFFLRALDTVLLFSLIGAAIYTAFFVEEKQFMIFACLVGLAVVNTIGRFTSKKVSMMRVQLNMLLREKKTEEQRTLMATRHTTVGGTKRTVVKTATSNPTTKK